MKDGGKTGRCRGIFDTSALLKVIVDEPGVGRSSADAPEIDGIVRFDGGKAGQFRQVLIDRADAHAVDLIQDLLEELIRNPNETLQLQALLLQLPG